MIFKIDDISFENVSVESLKREIKIRQGKNTGTFLSGKDYYDTKKSYITYEMRLNASTLSPTDYDTLFDIFAKPVETHKLDIIYGQSYLSFEAHISKVSDSCLKVLPDRTLWGSLIVSFEAAEALNV